MAPDGCKITACPGARERSHPHWCAAHIAESRAECLANWPEAFNGGFNPACCRFPKSCSIEDAPSPAPVADETAVERLADEFNRHRPYITQSLGLLFPTACDCGERTPGWKAWDEHLARAVLAALPDLGYVRATEPDQLAERVKALVAEWESAANSPALSSRKYLWQRAALMTCAHQVRALLPETQEGRDSDE